MVIPKDPPGHYHQEGNTQATIEIPVDKITANKLQQPTNAPNDDDDGIVPIPHDMFDFEPIPTPVLASTANATSRSPIKVKLTALHVFSCVKG